PCKGASAGPWMARRRTGAAGACSIGAGSGLAGLGEPKKCKAHFFGIKHALLLLGNTNEAQTLVAACPRARRTLRRRPSRHPNPARLPSALEPAARGPAIQRAAVRRDRRPARRR